MIAKSRSLHNHSGTMHCVCRTDWIKWVNANLCETVGQKVFETLSCILGNTQKAGIPSAPKVITSPVSDEIRWHNLHCKMIEITWLILYRSIIGGRSLIMQCPLMPRWNGCKLNIQLQISETIQKIYSISDESRIRVRAYYICILSDWWWFRWGILLWYCNESML